MHRMMCICRSKAQNTIITSSPVYYKYALLSLHYKHYPHARTPLTSVSFHIRIISDFDNIIESHNCDDVMMRQFVVSTKYFLPPANFTQINISQTFIYRDVALYGQARLSRDCLMNQEKVIISALSSISCQRWRICISPATGTQPQIPITTQCGTMQ